MSPAANRGPHCHGATATHACIKKVRGRWQVARKKAWRTLLLTPTRNPLYLLRSAEFALVKQLKREHSRPHLSTRSLLAPSSAQPPRVAPPNYDALTPLKFNKHAMSINFDKLGNFLQRKAAAQVKKATGIDIVHVGRGTLANRVRPARAGGRSRR